MALGGDLRETARGTLQPAHGPSRRQRLLRATVLAGALGMPFGVLAAAVRVPVPAVLRLDESTVRAATDLTRSVPALRRTMLVWQEVSRPVWVNVVIALLCVWVWRRHGLRRRALWAFLSLVGAWVLQRLAKEVVQRPRPVVEDAVTLASGYSFPSGHATNAAAAAVVVTVLVRPLLGARGRVAVPAAAAAAVLLTAADRVLLGVHYPSDVTAGVLFGVAVTGTALVARGPVGEGTAPGRRRVPRRPAGD